MAKYTLQIAAITLLCVLLLTACGSTAAPVTPTPDLCAPEHIAAQVERIHRLTREFEDASRLAANTAISNLYAPVSDLQRIHREAQDLSVPACLDKMHGAQLAYMKMVVDTLVTFMGGAADVNALGKGIAQSRVLHDQYNVEVATALGLPIVTATPVP